MANLIVTIIAIALMSFTAVMSVHYGGDMVQRSREKALANTIVQQANAIQTAVRMYKDIDYTKAIKDITMPELTGRGYLTFIPEIKGAVWTLDGLGNASLQNSAKLSIVDSNNKDNLCFYVLKASSKWTCSTATGVLFKITKY
jgi:hypothetical protein